MAGRNSGTFLKAAALLGAVILAGCATARPVLDQPRGFAEYRDRSAYRAVSPEGVVLRARLADNEPAQTLEFWAEALKTQLVKSGYSPVGEEAVETRSGPGIILEWAAPVGQEDWIYLTGIALSGSHVVVVEAAGAYQHFQKHRAAILDSLRTLEVR